MFTDIFKFLLEIAFTLFGAALILRTWMQTVRIPPFHPLAQAVLRGTEWLIGPLRRLVPHSGKIEWSCLIAAWLVALIYVVLQWLLATSALFPLTVLPAALGVSLLAVVKWTLNLIVWLTLIQAVLSWVNPSAPMMPLLSALTAPLLAPIRRVLPSTSIDFSSLIVLVIAQVGLMIIGRTSYQLFGFWV